ncbi:hypothetical protein [Cryobacterium sp. PH31-L1]|uniref:type II secretion system protein n=1 Tax=Cryobacterium sp. PH31-L1 TaxID=3046199 RepID=UPI0024BB3089|nr:hypothetical protein [Cryobacterium sp. PH31-L1]MDJ0376021.1 hypothetical protein [Cryobacterium sp. PH31-L1]
MSSTHQVPRQAGYTLVELLIYSSLLVLILTVVGGMLLNTITSEDKVIASADANAVSQLIASSVHSGVRNATKVQVTETTDTGDATENDNQLLLVTSVSSDAAKTAAARVCQAWYYTGVNGGAMYYKRMTPPELVDGGTAVKPFDGVTADSLAGDVSGWTLLGSGLSDTDADSQLIFIDLGSDNPSISLNFAINADGDSSPALISTTVTSRQSTASDGTPCF